LDEHCVNPYGDGHSSERILDLLVKSKKENKWLIKNLTY
jgi:UDP-N-acetylglucosamine 2-epimerase